MSVFLTDVKIRLTPFYMMKNVYFISNGESFCSYGGEFKYSISLVNDLTNQLKLFIQSPLTILKQLIVLIDLQFCG